MPCVSSDPATPVTPTVEEIDRAEQSAQIAVGLIRRFVDTLRSVDAFAPIPTAALSAIRGDTGRRIAPERANACSTLALEDVRLMPPLRESNLLEEVVSACGTGEGGCTRGLLVEQNVSIDDEASSSDGERDRREVVNAICIPLLTLLAECYAVLDMVPQAQPLQRRGGQKPKPPKGLLSIADYTDCACLLEFLVSVSILPNLEESGAILPCPRDRVKLLPKSLSGRLHRRSLLWGDAVQMHSASRSIDECAWRDKMNELRKSSKAIGYVIALERFRPMLLPRHAADILAALFQSDRFQELAESKQPHTEVADVQEQDTHKAMLNIFLGRGSRTVQVAMGSQSICTQAVDPHTRARAYQSLLSGGTKTPQWLRRRVGSLLNSLAAANLRCVVDVFVVAASSMPTDDISAASARLGRVLCSVPSPSSADVKAIAENPGCSTNAHRYYQRLFQQLALLLDMASASSMAASKTQDVDTNFDPRVVAGVLTVWAVIDNLPYHMLERFALPMLANGLIPLLSIGKDGNNTESGTKRPPLRIAVRRILSLFSFAPITAMGLGKIYYLLLLPLRVDTSISGKARAIDELAGNITVLGQLVRVVAAGESNVVESSKVIQDALLALRMVVHGMSMGNKAVRVANLAEQDIIKSLSITLVDSVCINAMDVVGVRYKQVLDGGKHDVVIDSLPNVAELGDLAREMGSRAKIVVVDIVARLVESNEEASNEAAAGSGQGSDLPSVLFCLLLLIYFSGTGQDHGQDRGKQEKLDPVQLLPPSLRRNVDTAKLATMSMLPLCCEYCSPETLVLARASPASEDSTESFGVLTMIQLIVTSVAHRRQSQLTNMEDYGDRVGHIENINNADCMAASNKFMDYASCDLSMACSGVYVLRSEDADHDGIDDGPEGGMQHDGSDDDEETLLSIGSIVVSLLVALLELGEERRLPKEEEILSLLLPGLQVLSSPGERSDGDAGDTVSRLESEISEMASHAVALIRSRGVVHIHVDGGLSRVPRASGDSIQEKICQAEQDLRSDQPPIRARGVVTLRHVAQSFSQGLNNDSSLDTSIPSKAKPLIVEINGNNRGNGDNNLSAVSTLEQLMRLCLETLQDSESYVYLAAIQTLVAIADANAAKVVPILGRAVSLGVIHFPCDAPSSSTSAHHLMLSSVQRVKATEALLFAIRRRGDGIFAFGNELLELMLFGCHAQSQSQSKPGNNLFSGATASTIQSKTEIFFMGERTDDDVHESDDIDMDAEEEERRLRINTGGPVFDSEEDDVVRAGCISIVAELVAALPPVGLVRYCPALMELGKQVLRLDASRPMRRAAALLCREIYSVVVREFDDAEDETDAFLSFATAMASCDEETLRATLDRCLSANDVDEIVSSDPKSDASFHAALAVQGKVRLADPATMARCQEALEIRGSIDEAGIWTAARLLVASKTNQDKDDPATRAIIRRLQQTKKRNKRDSVQAMQGLRIDGDSLTFL